MSLSKTTSYYECARLRVPVWGFILSFKQNINHILMLLIINLSMVLRAPEEFKEKMSSEPDSASSEVIHATCWLQWDQDLCFNHYFWLLFTSLKKPTLHENSMSSSIRLENLRTVQVIQSLSSRERKDI